MGAGRSWYLPRRDTKGVSLVQDNFTTLRAFLAHFPPEQKSHVANLFLTPVRAGHHDPHGVHAAVYADLRQRIEQAERWGRENARDRFILDQVRADYDGALDFARWALAYEQLSPAEKARQKASRAREAIEFHMDRDEPTEKQVAYLRARGYVGPIESKRHASALIDIYMRGGRVETGGVA